MSEVQVPEGAQWRGTVNDCYYRVASGVVEIWRGGKWDSSGVMNPDPGRFIGNANYVAVDSHKGYPRESLPDVIARKRRELQAAGVEFESYIMPRDRAGIAAASAPAPLPDFTFDLMREHEPADGLLVLAPLSAKGWGL